jgi:hypothetical protein
MRELVGLSCSLRADDRLVSLQAEFADSLDIVLELTLGILVEGEQISLALLAEILRSHVRACALQAQTTWP